MRTIIMAFIFVLVSALTVSAETGLVNLKSSHNVKNTADRLETVLKEKGMTVFLRIDHSAGARKVGKQLRPMELVIFGNPKVGAPLMQCGQTIGIDLPQKALIWQDESGQVGDFVVSYTYGVEPLQRRRGRMTVAVAGSRADSCQAGSERVEERPARHPNPFPRPRLAGALLVRSRRRPSAPAQLPRSFEEAAAPPHLSGPDPAHRDLVRDRSLERGGHPRLPGPPPGGGGGGP